MSEEKEKNSSEEPEEERLRKWFDKGVISFKKLAKAAKVTGKVAKQWLLEQVQTRGAVGDRTFDKKERIRLSSSSGGIPGTYMVDIVDMGTESLLLNDRQQFVLTAINAHSRYLYVRILPYNRGLPQAAENVIRELGSIIAEANEDSKSVRQRYGPTKLQSTLVVEKRWDTDEPDALVENKEAWETVDIPMAHRKFTKIIVDNQFNWNLLQMVDAKDSVSIRQERIIPAQVFGHEIRVYFQTQYTHERLPRIDTWHQKMRLFGMLPLYREGGRYKVD